MIDAQHRELFERANALIETLLARPPDPARQRRDFTALVDHVSRHFADEESILARIGYSNLAAHARTHANLVEKAVDLLKRSDAGGIAFGDVVTFIANDVVARHLLTADADFVPALQRAVQLQGLH